MYTYKNKQKSMQLKIPFTAFWPGKFYADYLSEFNFLAVLKFGKHETTNRTLQSFSLVSVMDVLRTAYLVRTGKSGARNPPRSPARSTVFCVCPGCKLDRINHLFAGLTDRYTGSQNS
jgi:hypothetical protein